MTCSKTSVVVAEAVVVLRQLLQQNPDFKGSEAIVRRLAVLLVRSFTDDSHGDDKTRPNEHDQGGGTGGVAPTGSVVRATLAQPAARASIVWMLSEYHQHISGVASDVLRVLAKAFPELEEEVKMQVIYSRVLRRISRLLGYLAFPCCFPRKAGVDTVRFSYSPTGSGKMLLRHPTGAGSVLLDFFDSQPVPVGFCQTFTRCWLVCVRFRGTRDTRWKILVARVCHVGGKSLSVVTNIRRSALWS